VLVPLAFALSVSAELPVSIAVPSLAGQVEAIASDGTELLVVWNDQVRTPPTTQLFASRIDADGHVLDAVPLAIAPSSLSQWGATAAFDGTAFLVAWTELEDAQPSVNPPPNGTPHPAPIRLARIDPSGALVGQPVTIAPDSVGNPRLACGGQACWLAWLAPPADPTTGYGGPAEATRIALDGTAIDQPPKLAMGEGTSDGDVDVACAANRDECMVIQGETTNVLGERFASDGTALDASPLAPCSDPLALECPSTAGLDVYAVRLSEYGRVLDTPAVAVSTQTLDETSPLVAGFGDGSAAIVYTRTDRDPRFDVDRLRLRKLTGDDAKLDGNPSGGCSVAWRAHGSPLVLLLLVPFFLVGRGRRRDRAPHLDLGREREVDRKGVVDAPVSLRGAVIGNRLPPVRDLDFRSRRRSSQRSTVWTPEDRTVRGHFDAPSALVNEPMMRSAKERQVPKLRRPTLRPVANVMRVDDPPAAGRERAPTAVTNREQSSKPRRDNARLRSARLASDRRARHRPHAR
jgi:hypothetical protein